jgi:hypothetical protein
MVGHDWQSHVVTRVRGISTADACSDAWTTSQPSEVLAQRFDQPL